MNKTNHKIAEQSKKSHTDALLKVMEQYDFKEITVTQISQEAKLSRKTFYRLFKNKEEILDQFLINIMNEFSQKIKDEEISDYWNIIRMYFDFWKEKKELLLLFKKNNLLFLLYEISYKHSFNIFNMVHSEKNFLKFSNSLPYILAYSIGGLHSMLIKWVEDDMIYPYDTFLLNLKKSFEPEEEI